MRYPHVMIDLETLGLVPGSTILSIGAVAFDPDMPYGCELGPKIHLFIDREDSRRVGLVEDPDTVKWWSEQSEPARKIFDVVDVGGPNHHWARPLEHALIEFNTYLGLVGGGDPVCVWGNGASFDNALLEAAYHQVGYQVPWPYHANRCFRTLRALLPKSPMPRVGTLHDALDDATTQATHAVRLLRAIYGEA